MPECAPGARSVAPWIHPHRERAATLPGFLAKTKGLSRKAARSLDKKGLLEWVGADHWVHGVGNTEGWKLTAAGRELVRVGRMLARLA